MQKSEKIEDYIFRNIRIKRWKPGDKLPSEKVMCKTLNVSEVTLRVALKTLANRGIIKRIRGAGSYVSDDISMNKIIIFAKMESFAYNTGYIYRMIAAKLKNIITENGMLPELVIADGTTTEDMFANLQFERRNDLHEIRGAISLCSSSRQIFKIMKKYHIPMVNLAGFTEEGMKKDVGNFVYINGQSSFDKGIKILRDAGVTDFALFHVCSNTRPGDVPAKSYHHDVLAEFGLPADDRHLVNIPGEWDRHSAYQAFANWLSLPDRPKVAFLLEDNICNQALYSIWERRIKIPDDLQRLTCSSGQFFHSPVPLDKLELNTDKIAELLFDSVMALGRSEDVEFPIFVSAEYKPGESLVFTNKKNVSIAKVVERMVVRPAVASGSQGPWKSESDYCFTTGDEKFEILSDITGRDRYDNFKERFSTDNGVSWGIPREIFKSENDNGNIRRWCELFQNLEVNSNSIYRMYLDGIYENDLEDKEYGSASFRKNRFVAVQRSFNGGKDFSEADNITELYRKSSGRANDKLIISCSHLYSLDNGAFIVPMCLDRNDANMTGIMLIGRSSMRADGACRTQWSFSKPLQLSDADKDYNLTEGSVVQLPDGRLFVVYRAHSMVREKNKTENWVKFCAVSNDNGMTWSEPHIMHYADGKNLCSPSSMSRLVMHSSGRLFMIGNIYGREYPEDMNCAYGRNQLSMIEIDIESLMPIEETLTVIFNRTASMNEDTAISNFTVNLDRNNGDILIYVPIVYAERLELSDSCLVNFRVRIEN